MRRGLPSSAEAEIKQPAKIADLYSKCSEIVDQQEQEKSKMVGTILPVLAWLNEPVVLRPKALGGSFLDFRSATLETGAIVVMTDAEGEISSRQLSDFKMDECLAILNEAFPELQRMTASKRRAGQVKPLLSMRAALAGSHLLVERRSYRLVVSNAGGDCIGLRVSTRLPEGGSRASRPVDLARGKEAEVDLDVYKEVAGKRRLEIKIDCKDVDGRELMAEETVQLGSDEWQEIQLKRKN